MTRVVSGSKNDGASVAVRLLQAGHTYAEVAEAIGIGSATVNRAWREFRESGEVSEPRRRGGRFSSIGESDEPVLKRLVESMPDATYDELTVAWNRGRKAKASRSAVIRKVLKLGFTRKKKAKQASQKKSKKVRAKRAMFRFARKHLTLAKLVFLDEAGFQCKLSRSHARSLRGTRATSYESAAPSKNFTITGAIRLSGPVVMQGDARTMTKTRFLCFLRQSLLPRLCSGDVLVMDNLAAHRNRMVRKICRAWNVRVVYLPPYSPEYNPIEKVWAWMKNRLRGRLNRAANCFRYAVAGAWRKAASLCMKNLFRGCGYIQSCEVI